MVLNCINDNFNIFLNKEYYTILDSSSFRQKHSYYQLNDQEYTFNHHNPLKKDDYLYFERCCLRFQNLLQKSEFKMFITMFLNYTKIDEEFINKIVDFNNNFGSYTNNYGLLCIVNYISDFNYHHFIKRNNIHILELYTTSPSNGKEFEKKEDNEYLHNIITSIYNFDLNEIEQVQTIDQQETQVKKEKKVKVKKEKKVKEKEKEIKEQKLKEIKEKIKEIKEQKETQVKENQIKEQKETQVKETQVKIKQNEKIKEELIEIIEDTESEFEYFNSDSDNDNKNNIIKKLTVE
jgi:hypothetical protein